jgi:DNA-binding MarR family transcriptional regulator
MSQTIDFREIAGCTCLLSRRATRQLTQIYDAALQPVGLTINQFGVLSHLYGASLDGRGHISVGALADLIGKHPSTLNRDLTPLSERGLVADVPNRLDGRIRALSITAKGRKLLHKAAPKWRAAEARIQKMLGVKTKRALGSLLEFASTKLAKD